MGSVMGVVSVLLSTVDIINRFITFIIFCQRNFTKITTNIIFDIWPFGISTSTIHTHM